MRRDLRDVYLSIERGLGFGLYLGCLGWAAFTSPVLKPVVPVWIDVVIAASPALIVFTVTFAKKPLLPPRAFRLSLILAMCWFASLVIAAEVLCYLGYMPPDSPKYARTISRALMHVGWISFVPLVRCCIIARRYERPWDRRARRALKVFRAESKQPSN